MNMRVTGGLIAAMLASVAGACSSGTGGDEGVATEQGAIDAVLEINRGMLKGDAQPYLDHLSADCKERVDEETVKTAIRFVGLMMADSKVNPEEIGTAATIAEFTGDAATVAVTFTLPEGADEDLFDFEDESMDVMVEDGNWVLADCEFGGESDAEAEELAGELEALGYAGTRDEPVPAQVGAPVGGGYTVSVDGVLDDASDYIESAGGFTVEPEPGSQTVLVNVTVGYTGETEPAPLGELSFQIVGGRSAVGVDLYSCGSIPEELDTYATVMMSGGVVSGAVCGDVPADDIDGMVLGVKKTFGETSVFFDPMVDATTPVPVVGASGPVEGADLTEARMNPIAVGTSTDVGEGFAVTVTGADLDATQRILDFSEFNQPPPAGYRFVLIDVEMSYNGEEESVSPTFVELDVVGNSNVGSPDGNCQVSFDGELDQFANVFIGGTVSGAVCFRIADSDVDSLVVLASSGFETDTFVLAVR